MDVRYDDSLWPNHSAELIAHEGRWWILTRNGDVPLGTMTYCRVYFKGVRLGIYTNYFWFVNLV